MCILCFFFKQKTAYEMRISDWSSDVCSSDLTSGQAGGDLNREGTREIFAEVAAELGTAPKIALIHCEQDRATLKRLNAEGRIHPLPPLGPLDDAVIDQCEHVVAVLGVEHFISALDGGADIILGGRSTDTRSEEHTSEHQSLIRISYAVFCLK